MIMNASNLLLTAHQMLSLDIAELVQSELRAVNLSIERLAKRGVIQLPPLMKVENKQSVSPNRFSNVYVFSGEQGKLDSITVVAQLCREFTAAIVKRWYELEQQTPTFDISNSQADTYCLELQRHQQEPDDQYDAGDLHDAYSLSYENTSWLETMFYQVKDEVEVVKEAIKQNTHGAIFGTLEHLIHIAAYLAGSHSNTFDIERENYEIQWKATKNG